MRNFQQIAMLAGLVLLVVVVAGTPNLAPVSFLRGLSGALPWIVIGIVVFMVMGGRGGCGRACRSSRQTADETN